MCLHCAVTPARSLTHRYVVLGVSWASSLWAARGATCSRTEEKTPFLGEASPLETGLSWSRTQTASQPCMRSVHVKTTRTQGGKDMWFNRLEGENKCTIWEEQGKHKDDFVF